MRDDAARQANAVRPLRLAVYSVFKISDNKILHITYLLFVHV